MMRHICFFYILMILVLQSCSTIGAKRLNKSISSISLQVVYENSEFSTRAIQATNNGVYFTGNLGISGFVDKSGQVNLLPSTATTHQFRSIALTGETGVPHILSIGNPAILYRLNEPSNLWEAVYTEEHPSVFYDSMKFWNEKDGIAFGDQLDGETCMSVIITNDSGRSWRKLSCDEFVQSNKESSGAFAASNSNISIIGDTAWLASGTRIYKTDNKGESWSFVDPPIINGTPTKGIYSIDFYDAQTGVAIGGDYLTPEDNTNNLFKTIDGGNTWQIISDEDSPGYRSQIKFIPNRDANELIAVGFNGIDVSQDGGDTWVHLSDESFYTIDFFPNERNQGVLGGNNKIAFFSLNY